MISFTEYRSSIEIQTKNEWRCDPLMGDNFVLSRACASLSINKLLAKYFYKNMFLIFFNNNNNNNNTNNNKALQHDTLIRPAPVVFVSFLAIITLTLVRLDFDANQTWPRYYVHTN